MIGIGVHARPLDEVGDRPLDGVASPRPTAPGGSPGRRARVRGARRRGCGHRRRERARSRWGRSARWARGRCAGRRHRSDGTDWSRRRRTRTPRAAAAGPGDGASKRTNASWGGASGSATPNLSVLTTSPSRFPLSSRRRATDHVAGAPSARPSTSTPSARAHHARRHVVADARGAGCLDALPARPGSAARPGRSRPPVARRRPRSPRPTAHRQGRSRCTPGPPARRAARTSRHPGGGERGAVAAGDDDPAIRRRRAPDRGRARRDPGRRSPWPDRPSTRTEATAAPLTVSTPTASTVPSASVACRGERRRSPAVHHHGFEHVIAVRRRRRAV